jgi:hypothetical protein
LGARKIDAFIDRTIHINQKAFFYMYQRKTIREEYLRAIKHNVFEIAHQFLMREAFVKIGIKAKVLNCTNIDNKEKLITEETSKKVYE